MSMHAYQCFLDHFSLACKYSVECWCLIAYNFPENTSIFRVFKLATYDVIFAPVSVTCNGLLSHLIYIYSCTCKYQDGQFRKVEWSSLKFFKFCNVPCVNSFKILKEYI